MNEELVIDPSQLSATAELVGIHNNMVAGFWLLFLIIAVLSILVYKLGFAKKLPILKSIIIYIMLLIGCLPLTFFGIGLPVAEGLAITAIVLGIYRYRLHKSREVES